MVWLPVETDLLRERFDAPDVKSLVLLGSHARGDAGPFSDIDLLRLVPVGDPRAGQHSSYVVDDHLVVISDVDLDRVEQWFTRPELAVAAVAGLRDGVALVDRADTFVSIRGRAEGFVWDERMRQRGDEWVSAELVGWIEEVHKGLNGLLNGHAGALLNARYGLTWGMVRIVQVHHGLLCRSDNDFLHVVTAQMGEASQWATMLRRAFGIEPSTLADQVRAGLGLYVLTARHVQPAIRPDHAPLVARTLGRIEAALLQ
jgi:predicted nucleotidyltransferase